MKKPVDVSLGSDPDLEYAYKLANEELIAISQLNNLSHMFYLNSVEHGFHDEDRSFDRCLMLAVGELTEAHEEFRSGHGFTEVYYRESDNKPEGIATELADLLIRVLDTAGKYKIDIAAAVAEKHGFNKTRPYKHGRLF